MSVPVYYRGDGTITCADAERSMLTPLADVLAPMEIKWVTDAFEYMWRFSLKGQAESDLDKAIDCLNQLKSEYLARVSK